MLSVSRGMAWISALPAFALGKSLPNIKQVMHTELLYDIFTLDACSCIDWRARNFTLIQFSLLTGEQMSKLLLLMTSSLLYLKRVYRELLLIEGISQEGLGNWQMIAEHIGTRTKEDVEEHYNSVYVDSPNWPLPVRLYDSSLSLF
jgi:hypothetical protein